MPASFKYQARTSEQWAKREKGSIFEGYAEDQFQTFSPKKENWIRILPPTWENPNHYGLDLWVHFGVGPNNATVICLQKMRNERCPVCDAFARAETQGNEKAAAEYKPTRRVLVWVLDRNDEKQPLLWALPWTVDRDISKICRDRQTGELYQIDHPDGGFDVTFDKEGEGITTKYTGFALSRKASSVDDRHLQYVLEHPLPTTLLWRTFDEVKALFVGVEPEPTNAPNINPAPQPNQPIVTPPSFAPQQAPAVTPQPIAPVQAAPPPPQAFVSEWTNTHCSVCGQPQYTSPSGITCSQGHGGAPSREEIATQTAAPPPGNGAAAPPPAAAPEPAVAAGRAANLRERFKTGTR